MKNLKTITLLLASLFILSCSKDDDSPTVAKEYFPTKITTTVPSDPPKNGTTVFQYDSNNRITQFKYENTLISNIYDVSYNAESLVSKIITTKNASSGVTSFTINYNYTNNILSQIIITSGSGTSSTPFNVTYDSSTKTYTIGNSTSTSTYLFKQDNYGNITEFTYEGLIMTFALNTDAKGIYNGINNNLPMLLTSLFSGIDATLYYSHFFANKEITSFSLTALGINYDSTLNRDSNTNISEISFTNTFNSEVKLSSTIEYEERIVN